jgi:hypothetical protein
MEKLAAALTEMGHPIGADTVRKELVRLGFAARFASGSVLLTRGKAEVQLGNCEQRIDATRRGALDPSYRHKCCVRGVSADSDEVAQAFRDDVARRSEMMSPGCNASVAADFWHSIAERSIVAGRAG